jgi:hypothetical protein
VSSRSAPASGIQAAATADIAVRLRQLVAYETGVKLDFIRPGQAELESWLKS